MDDIVPPKPPTPTPVTRPVDDATPNASSAPTIVRRVTVNTDDTPKPPTFSSKPPISTPAPKPKAPDEVVPVAVAPEKPADTKPSELIPGLNTKPSEESFNESAPAPALPKDPTNLETPAKTEKLDAPLQTKPSKQPSKKGHAAAIIVAVLFALALIGGAGYAYLQKKNEKAASKTETTTTSTATKNPAKADDVDKTSTAIDESLKKVDDTKDFQETDLSDETLGL